MDRSNLLKLNNISDEELEKMLNEKGIPLFISELKISREWLYKRLRTSGYTKKIIYKIGKKK